MSDPGSVEATRSNRRETTGMPEDAQVQNRDSVPRGLGSPQAIPNVSSVVMNGKNAGITETGEKPGKIFRHSAEVTSEGGGSNGEGAMKGDSEAGAVLGDTGEELNAETKVGVVRKEEEGCPACFGGPRPGLRWGGMRFS